MTAQSLLEMRSGHGQWLDINRSPQFPVSRVKNLAHTFGLYNWLRFGRSYSCVVATRWPVCAPIVTTGG